MNSETEGRVLWKSAVQIIAVFGLLWACFFSVMILYSLFADSSNRGLPMVWFFGILLGPILGAICWRLFLLRRWAAFAVCGLTLIMLNDFVTGPTRAGIWNPFSITVCVGSAVVALALLSRYDQWQSGF